MGGAPTAGRGTNDAGTRRWSLVPAGLLLALVAALFLRESLFGGKILTQIDALLLFEPWASVSPADFEASNPLLLDQALQMLPFLDFFRERLAAGEMPLWNPHNYAGHPVAAVPTGGLYWPLHWVYFAFPSWGYHAWSAWLRLTLTGVFTLLFLRELGRSRWAAALGATAFTFSGFGIVWLNHPHTQVSMFLPFALWLVERAAKRPSARLAGLAAPVFALIFLGGHLQTAAHVLMGIGAWVLFRLAVPVGGRRLAPRGLGTLVAAGALGVAIAMPLLLPFFEYMRVSHGAVVSAELDLVGAVDPLTAMGFLVAPDRLGHPLEGTYTGPVGPHLNYQELVGGWVGLVALGFAALGLVAARRRRSTWFFAGLGLFALLVACQVPPFYEAMRAVPLVQSSKLFRLFLLVALSLAVLGSAGLDAVLARLADRRPLAAAVGVVATLAVALELGVWGYGYNPAIEPDSPTFLPETEVTEFLRSDEGLHRVLGQKSSFLIPNANLFYDVDLVTGYDAMEYRTMVDLVALLTTSPAREMSIKEIPFFDRPLPLWNLLGVKYVLADTPLPAPLELVHESELLVYENPAVLPRAFAARDLVVLPEREDRLAFLGSVEFDPTVAVLEDGPVTDARLGQGRVEVTVHEPRRVVVEAELDAPGLVVLTDAWDPGWRATVDGAPAVIERVDHSLRGVRVGAGPVRIELVHDPASFTLGLWAALVGLVASVLLATRPRTIEPRP